MVKNQRSNSTGINWVKIVSIVVVALVAAALIVSLVSCQKKTSSDNKKERKVEDKDKKPKKKDDGKLTFEKDDEDNKVAYRYFETSKVTTSTTSSSSTSGGSITPPVEKYDSEIALNGDESITLEYKEEAYSEQGAKYTNKKGSTIVSSGDVSDIKIYKDGETVNALNLDSPVGEYSVVYNYTNPDGEALTATRNVVIQDTIAPTIASTKSVSGNTATVTLTITDHSEIGDVTVVGATSGEVAYGDNYTFTTGINDTFTVTAKDIYENTATSTVTVNELLTEDEINGTITVNNQNRRVSKNNGENTTVTNMRYASTRSDHSSSVNTSTFKNPETGQYYDEVSIGGRNRDVTPVNGNRTSQLDRNTYYYVYYEVTKTTTDGDNTYTATAADVQTVHFN